MKLFPKLEESFLFSGTQEEALSVLHDLVQPKQLGIVLKYTKPFYGVVSTSDSRFRIAHWHNGFYWFSTTLTPREQGTHVQIELNLPKWRRFAFLMILVITIFVALSIPFFVPTRKDSFIAIFPLFLAWGAWVGKRDDYRLCGAAFPVLTKAFHSKVPSGAA